MTVIDHTDQLAVPAERASVCARCPVPKYHFTPGQKGPGAIYDFNVRREIRSGTGVALPLSMKAILVVFLGGCGMFATTGSVAQKRAATDLTCPRDQVSTYGAGDGVVVASGCGKWTEYACFVSRTGPVCVREAPAAVMPNMPAS